MRRSVASSFDFDCFTVDIVRVNPTIDSASVVTDEIAFAVLGFDKVQVMSAVDFDQYNIADFELY